MSRSADLDVQSPRGRRSVLVPADASSRLLTDLLRHVDLPLNTRCGQRGQCDGCVIELVDGRLVESTSGQSIGADDEAVRVRACQHCLLEGEQASIRIPARSLLAHKAQVVTSFRINVPRAFDPLWPVPAETSERCLGAAIDIGTTTVVVLLVDLATGDIVGEAAALNAQADLGDNVLTRINLCITDDQMVGRMQESVVHKTIGPLLQEALDQADASADQLACMAVAGNSTMLHLLHGVNPASMGFAPFTPTFIEHRVIPAGQLPWVAATSDDEQSTIAEGSEASEDSTTRAYQPESNDPPVHLLPGAAAYVGADVVAGVLSSGMAYSTDTCLLADVGTNGEIVLKHGEHVLACATAAGPAFEGSGLICGMRAGKGAIGHVRIARDTANLEIDVIGGGKAIGLCGTAYVDVIAQSRQLGLIGPTGRFVEDVENQWPVEQMPRGRALIIAQGRGEEPIHITEGDIASLLQAKAAIAAGIICLLDRVGLRSEDVKTLFLAGGFGFHMDVQHAIDFGLLPGFRASQVQLIGNSSLAGAYLALLDSGALDEISRIGSAIETVELNLEPQFESTYIDQLSL